MNKHTPGPWEVHVHDSETSIESEHFTIASDVPNCDASLIAAAPDLLAVLQDILAHTNAPDWLAVRARAAIAKAEGVS